MVCYYAFDTMNEHMFKRRKVFVCYVIECKKTLSSLIYMKHINIKHIQHNKRANSLICDFQYICIRNKRD